MFEDILKKISENQAKDEALALIELPDDLSDLSALIDLLLEKYAVSYKRAESYSLKLIIKRACLRYNNLAGRKAYNSTRFFR